MKRKGCIKQTTASDQVLKQKDRPGEVSEETDTARTGLHGW